MDTGRKKQLEKFIDVLGLSSFHNLLILDQALTHSSYANENKAKHGYYNERLEFLGDAILDLVVGEYLFLQYPHMPEGELSKARASVVSEAPLAAVCATFDMGDYILLGKENWRRAAASGPAYWQTRLKPSSARFTLIRLMKKRANLFCIS